MQIMFSSLNNVDWNLLHQQKLVLLRVLDGMDRDTPVAEALWGIMHLLDALQDDAATAGRWVFPDEPASPSAAQTPPLKRYYVEDDEGHHYGPLDDYEEAASVADAIHGLIIAQEVDRPSASMEHEDENQPA
jgi:hypothetical protein